MMHTTERGIDKKRLSFIPNDIEIVTCPICLNILSNPQIDMGCSKAFCLACIQAQISDTGKCVCGDIPNLVPFLPINLYNAMKELKIICHFFTHIAFFSLIMSNIKQLANIKEKNAMCVKK